MARNKGFMLIYPYFLFPNGFYKAYFRKFIVRLVTHVTMECSIYIISQKGSDAIKIVLHSILGLRHA